jgi:hypothetical protein
VLQKENGEKIAEVFGLALLDRDPRDPEAGSILPKLTDGHFHYLPYLDSAGDTYFNGRQMIPFLKEWDLLVDRIRTTEQMVKLLAVRTLALRCASQPHLFLRFVGD